MFFVLVMVLISFFLVVLLKLVSYTISESGFLMREELTSYECGFEHHSLSRIPFSLRYFLLTLIFLLFDLEIVLLLFFPFASFSPFGSFSMLIVVFFISFLFFGLLYEWKDGSLEWIM